MYLDAMLMPAAHALLDDMRSITLIDGAGVRLKFKQEAPRAVSKALVAFLNQVH